MYKGYLCNDVRFPDRTAEYDAIRMNTVCNTSIIMYYWPSPDLTSQPSYKLDGNMFLMF